MAITVLPFDFKSSIYLLGSESSSSFFLVQLFGFHEMVSVFHRTVFLFFLSFSHSF